MYIYILLIFYFSFAQLKSLRWLDLKVRILLWQVPSKLITNRNIHALLILSFFRTNNRTVLSINSTFFRLETQNLNVRSATIKSFQFLPLTFLTCIHIMYRRILLSQSWPRLLVPLPFLTCILCIGESSCPRAGEGCWTLHHQG